MLDGRLAPQALTILLMARRTAELKAGRGGRPVLADPFYYLNNFRAVLTSLQSRYGALLARDEREFIRQFALLPEPSCALLVRMIMRRGRCFRLSRLEYPEIGDAAAAAAPLFDIGWVEEPVLTVDELHLLLTKAELFVHLALPRRLERLSKPELLEATRKQCAEPRPFHRWCAQTRDRVIRPVVKALAERFSTAVLRKLLSRLDRVRSVGPRDQRIRGRSRAVGAVPHENANRCVLSDV